MRKQRKSKTLWMSTTKTQTLTSHPGDCAILSPKLEVRKQRKAVARSSSGMECADVIHLIYLREDVKFDLMNYCRTGAIQHCLKSNIKKYDKSKSLLDSFI
ncbi:hypothetical protein CDAR_203791 [Caerostris darwini]|uniref:Uncharacterized protein n=1 Tax=Caerostris darwini TaxID=1538125 RepID=A0AAV4P964_9ARAC|nr:hypothetical protein CDAR_203791 [Caerostris darwini]